MHRVLAKVLKGEEVGEGEEEEEKKKEETFEGESCILIFSGENSEKLYMGLEKFD